mmetsp:Transcript_5379/g.10560  ORF Transcript_5379/g.10560 Transcript_5379/m.10560 type:complete len:242 (+) Transcript_5379:28-753(+)
MIKLCLNMTKARNTNALAGPNIPHPRQSFFSLSSSSLSERAAASAQLLALKAARLELRNESGNALGVHHLIAHVVAALVGDVEDDELRLVARVAELGELPHLVGDLARGLGGEVELLGAARLGRLGEARHRAVQRVLRLLLAPLHHQAHARLLVEPVGALRHVVDWLWVPRELGALRVAADRGAPARVDRRARRAVEDDERGDPFHLVPPREQLLALVARWDGHPRHGGKVLLELGHVTIA